MGLFDKLKNVFMEDDIDEEPVRSVPKVEEIKKEEPVIQKRERELPVEDTFSDRELVNSKENFKFPIIFEDEDFKEEKKKTKSINVLERENTKYEDLIKRDTKPQKKVFKPSLVISPVYGVLDKNYSKEDITTKDGNRVSNDNGVDIDTVIKKAYGEEVVTKTREEKREEENKTVDAFKEEETDIKSLTIEQAEIKANEKEVDDKIASIDELLNDTNTDDDFYSLVDSMYKNEEGDKE
ncbi:MAG: hypothetical protein PUJ60_00920 [bacterium]|nr:hypothetical protein [bacterium]MDY4109042.1 hypothetical protein [Bacilli bacterium]